MSESLILERTRAAKAPARIARNKITEPYARMMARHLYFWAWPMANIYNRRLVFDKAPEPGLMNGVLPLAPLNTLSMLHDYIEPEQRWVACPNQDVVYGAGILALERSPVVIQVPDFGSRFWVYQAVDLRTDSYMKLGAMYGSKPGFYLIAGPDWNEPPPNGIIEVVRCPSQTSLVAPRLFLDDTAEDRAAVQQVIAQIDLYALDRFDGTVKRRDWTKVPAFNPPPDNAGSGETRWVFPETFFDQLPTLMKDAPARAGEEALYDQAFALIEAANQDSFLRSVMIDEARRTDFEIIDPLLQFRDWGLELPNHWSKVTNGAAFGTDYFSRTAVARSNILVNAPQETQYLYQDLDAEGDRLNGRNRYEVTFEEGRTPPVQGFWSLTLYDEHHFFVPNPIKRYSLGTKNKCLTPDGDGSLTIYVQSESPGPELESNWLPSPEGADFSLFIRGYWPDTAMIDGAWAPPAVRRKR